MALEPLKDRILDWLYEELLPDPMIDRIDGRVKSTERFVRKAAKEENAGPKYPNPLKEIQDQIGIRIIVRFVNERLRVREKVLALFNPVENVIKEPAKPNEFDYEAVHLVCFVPPDLKRELGAPIDFFEVQICTLFGHAYAEANHDLGYKAETDLTPEQQVLIGLAAASAKAADLLFQQVKDQRDKHIPIRTSETP